MMASSGGSASLTAQAVAAAISPAAHNRAMWDGATPVEPMRRLMLARSSANSIQPAIPAEAVRPAAPHSRARPIRGGTITAKTYPSVVTATRRTIA